MLLIDTVCFFTPTGPFNRDFGNSLDLCLNPIQHPPDFCASQNVPDTAPTSFVRYRTINGTCNNLLRGKATLGAAGIVAARFLPESMYLNLQLYIQKTSVSAVSSKLCETFWNRNFTCHVWQLSLRISLSVIFL